MSEHVSGIFHTRCQIRIITPKEGDERISVHFDTEVRKFSRLSDLF
ncbi:hypothetical protein AB4Z22_00995 [Paenibacillus sp. TAF58]